jgi:hypothetical protein
MTIFLDECRAKRASELEASRGNCVENPDAVLGLKASIEAPEAIGDPAEESEVGVCGGRAVVPARPGPRRIGGLCPCAGVH